MKSRERSEPNLNKMLNFQKILGKVEFWNYRYYFFTIKPNGRVALYDNAHDMVRLIDYVEKVMVSFLPIMKVVYNFELDSKLKLHIHGIMVSKEPLRYDSLYRDWGVHHHFTSVFYTRNKYACKGQMIDTYMSYATKDIIGPIIKSFKEEGTFTNIDTIAYW